MKIEIREMKQQLRNLIERTLIARPDAAPNEIRNLIPALRDKSDEEITALMATIRKERTKGTG
ncbi:hypothetical protein [Roseovarius sp. D0-M9]|uniref:hypothetical protein n=1 Tax=Roseovarius sp. D0-M9 TaxID=3127117 RepID=UPI00300F9373